MALIAAVVVLAGAAVDQASAARAVRAEVSAKISDGFARLVLHFSEEVESQTQLANNIIIVSFRAPVALAVDRLNEMLPGIVSAARRDPDGRGLRIALTPKVKMNAMQAGERLFIDLMPEDWSGPPPGLPRDVVEELARRAREAEKQLHKQQALARQRRQPVIRVRVGHQPTFSRYVFEHTGLVPVVTSREKNILTLVFDAPLKFDLADAKLALPPMVETIGAETREQSTAVRLSLIGNVDVRTFREDASFVVDVGIVEPPKRQAAKQVSDRGGSGERAPDVSPGMSTQQRAAASGIEAPETVPALDTMEPTSHRTAELRVAAARAAKPAASPTEPVPAPRAERAAEPAATMPAPQPASSAAPQAAAPQPAPADAKPQAAAPQPAPAVAKPQAANPPLMPQSIAPLAPIAAPPMLPVFDVPGVLSAAPSPAVAPSPVMAAAPPPALAAPAPAKKSEPAAPTSPPAAEPAAHNTPVVPRETALAPPPSPPPAIPQPPAIQPPPTPSEQATPAASPALPGLVIVDLELPPGYVSPGAPRARSASNKPAVTMSEPAKPALKPARPGAGERPGVKVTLARHGDDLVITFPFAAATPAAVFQRADTVWAVFDTPAAPDIAPLNDDTSDTIGHARRVSLQNGQAVGFKLTRPRLTTIRFDGPAVVITIGDSASEPPQPLVITRDANMVNQVAAAIPFEGARTVHRLTDPEVGDTLLVVTALGPPRGFLRGQNLIDFHALPSSHGVAIRAAADDLTAALSPDKIVLARPNGLSVSTGEAVVHQSGLHRPGLFDPQLWGFDREANFNERQAKLINAVVEAPDTKRTAPRLELARFYLARAMYPEAKGVLDVALSEDKPGEDPTGLVMRAFASIMMGHIEDALKDLAHPVVGSRHDSQIWRGFAFARQGHWSEANDNFRTVETAIAGLPIELQRLLLQEAARAAIEVHDFAAATNLMHGFETLGATKEMEPELAVLAGRIAEGLGRNSDALVNYRQAAASPVRPAAAQGRLRETSLRYHLGDLKRSEVISDLEELTTIWRGDETEIEALQILARLYTDDGRFRDAFHVMRTAVMAYPNSDMTRRIQDEASKTFDQLFLTKSGDALPVIDALGLFYDFRELTPIGRRGDEMIRRLSDRLVSVDLLDQAAELLQHQVDHRLQGAARAQVAIRLAVIYLMNHKPDHALATLRATQGSSLATDLRRQRLLLEARALSDTGRPDLALEVIANVDTSEAMRLRADILWSARRWRDSAEQIERLFGERWRDWQPLTDADRSDLLRAAVGYALAKDKLGLQRFRERYAAKMTTTPERHAFEVATNALNANSAEFRLLAHVIATGNTLDQFLRELRARYPETGAFSSRPTHAPPSQAALNEAEPTSSVARR